MICKYCGKDKTPDEFYPVSRLKCKKCYCERQREYDIKHKKRIAEYRKEYYPKWYAKNGRNRADNYCEAMIRWQIEHKEECKAKGKVAYAIKTGKLKRPNICSKCHKTKKTIIAHHDDYSKPLEVRWLCHSCHKLLHLELKRQVDRVKKSV
jgi:hypothetical protein